VIDSITCAQCNKSLEHEEGRVAIVYFPKETYMEEAKTLAIFCLNCLLQRETFTLKLKFLLDKA